MKEKDDHWYAVEAFAMEDEKVVASVNDRPARVHAEFFDECGDRVLTVVHFDMDAVPPADVSRLQSLVQAQQQTPALLLPSVARYVRLRRVSAAENRRLADEERRAAAEKEQAKKPSLIVAP